MSLKTAFPAQEMTVSLTMTDGTQLLGRIKKFSPQAELFLEPLPRGGKPEATPLRAQLLAPENIAMVAMQRKGSPPVPRGNPFDLQPVAVTVRGGVVVKVLANPAEISQPLGFQAFPQSDGGIYGLYWFYRHGVVKVENQELLGEMLLKAGVVDKDDLGRGLDEQKRKRSAVIGDILVEQRVVEPDDVQRAVEEQSFRESDKRRLRLGEILVESGLASEDDIARALEEQKNRRGKRLGQILVELGIVDQETIARTLAGKFNIPYIDLGSFPVDPAAFSQVPLDLILRYGILPIDVDDQQLTIAMSDPLAFEGIDMLRFSSDKHIKEVLVATADLDEFLEPYLAQKAELVTDDVQSTVEQLMSLDQSDEDPRRKSSPEEQQVKGVVKLIDHIIVDAFNRGASDIHIEPNGKEQETIVRIRIDGECETVWRLPPSYRTQMVARLKVMAKMDIAEKRKPQDGKIKFQLGNRDIELRMASLPTVLGDEDVVLRILASGEPIPMERLGLSQYNHQELSRIIQNPHGMILVVGPTGSGKTTTLHSILSVINTDSRKIWTAEDPVEITQRGLREVQMNPAVGLDFATTLRSFLRADPDVIMVGEMRDLETASIGCEASLTGHLVLSTLHTNSAPETVIRLVDMGVDPFMFSDALLGVLAQRLARRLCTNCRREYSPSPEEERLVRSFFEDGQLEELLEGSPLRLWDAPGCKNCRDKGYKGRLGIHELLVCNAPIRSAIQRREPASLIKKLAMANGMRTLTQDGIAKALRGLVSVQQVLAVCGR